MMMVDSDDHDDDHDDDDDDDDGANTISKYARYSQLCSYHLTSWVSLDV